MNTAATLNQQFQSPFQTSSQGQECTANGIVDFFEDSLFSGQHFYNDKNNHGHLNSEEPKGSSEVLYNQHSGSIFRPRTQSLIEQELLQNSNESYVASSQEIIHQYGYQNQKDDGDTYPRQNGLRQKRNINQRDINQVSHNQINSIGYQAQSQVQAEVFHEESPLSHKNQMNRALNNDDSFDVFYRAQTEAVSQPQAPQISNNRNQTHHPTTQQDYMVPYIDQTSQNERLQDQQQQLRNHHIGQQSYYQIENSCQNFPQVDNSTSIQGQQTDVQCAQYHNTTQQIIGSNDNHSVDHNKNQLSVQQNQISVMQSFLEKGHMIVPIPFSDNGSSIDPCHTNHTNKRVLKQEAKKSRGRGRPAINILVALGEKQPEAKDVKSVFRLWRKTIKQDLHQRINNKDSDIRTNLLDKYGETEFQKFVALINQEGKYKANSDKTENGVPLQGSSIKPGKELSEEEEESDIVGLLISSYNLRRLQKFFNQEMHRYAFRFYEEKLSKILQGYVTLLEALAFLIRVSYRVEHK